MSAGRERDGAVPRQRRMEAGDYVGARGSRFRRRGPVEEGTKRWRLPVGNVGGRGQEGKWVWGLLFEIERGNGKGSGQTAQRGAVGGARRPVELLLV